MAVRMEWRAVPFALVALTTGLLGCAGKDDGDSGGAIISAGGEATTRVCEGANPVVDGLSCVNNGILPHYGTGEDTSR